MTTTTLRLEIPHKMLPFWTEKARHKVARGGRGSSKSWSVARMLALKGVLGRTRWLCCREVQRSLKESAKRLLEDQIRVLGLSGYYDCQRDVIIGRNGSEFVFAGLQDHTADSIKSYEGFDGAWVEEAHTVSEQSAEILIPTIRAPGSEIWWTYNPTQDADYVHDRFRESIADEVLIVEINWRDNPWFPSELELERQRLKRLNQALYDHVWEGKCKSVAGTIIRRDWFRYYSKLPELLRWYVASDWATTEGGGDWTVHGAVATAPDGDVYFGDRPGDWYREQVHTGTGIDAALTLIKHRRPRRWFGEKGVIERAIDPQIRMRMRQREVRGVERLLLPAVGSKADRAIAFASRAQYGQVWLPDPDRCAWVEPLLNELASFTGERDGEVDDQADVCGLIGRGVELLSVPREPSPPPEPIRPFTERWLMYNEDSENDRRPRIV